MSLPAGRGPRAVATWDCVTDEFILQISVWPARHQSWSQILEIFDFMIFISNYQIKNLMKSNLSCYDDDEGVSKQ